MKEVINLTCKNVEKVMVKILTTYRDNTDILKAYRGRENYTVKYDFGDGIADVDVEVLEHYYLFHVKPENSILMMEKPSIPTFDVGLSLNDKHRLVWNKTPQSRDAKEWLSEKLYGYKGATTRADALIVLATVCQYIWGYETCSLIPCMKVREHGNTIEYAPRDDFMTFIDEWIKVLRRKHAELHRFDGWDVVNLTHNQLVKLGQTLEEHKIAHDFDNIPLHRYCLSLYEKGESMYYFMTHKNNNLHIEIEDSRTNAKGFCDISYVKLPDGRLSMELSENTNVMEWLTKITEMPDGEGVTYWQWLVDVFFSINSFMLHFGDVTMEVETKVAQEQTMNRQQRRHNKNAVRLFKSYKLIKNWKSQARKKAEITCPAWGVRGHFRHLRNGKVIFIESFVKGKERDKYKGKEYALLPYKDA